MTKKEELARVAAKLTACAEAMMELADVLSSTADEEAGAPPVQDAEAGAPSVQEPEAAYSFTDVRQAAADASRRGYRAEVKALLAKYGIEKLSALAEEGYAAFMKDLEGIGNG